MADAPKPGARRIAISEQLADASDDTVEIACEADGNRRYELRASHLGPQDEQLCMTQAGLPVWSLFGDGLSSMTGVLALYWMARRKAGEKGLTFAQVAKQYKNLDEFVNAGFSVWVPDDDEPDGRPDDDEDEVDGADPTQSGAP